MATLSGVLLDAEGSPIVGTVEASLVDPGTGRQVTGDTGDGTIAAGKVLRVTSDASGAWSLDLTANGNIVPTGTGWAIREQGRPTRIISKADKAETMHLGPDQVTFLDDSALPATPASVIGEVAKQVAEIGPGDIGADPAGSADAVRDELTPEIGGRVARSGDTMAGPLDLDGNRLTGLPAPAAASDAARQAEVLAETSARAHGDGLLSTRSATADLTLTDVLDMVGRVAVGAETLAVDDAARKSAGLTQWIDGLIGRADIAGQIHCWAPNGPSTARWVLDPDGDFVDSVEATNVTFPTTSPGTGYAAGGPIYAHDGRLWMIYHGEKYPMGDGGASGFWSYLGLATTLESDPDGWVDLGPIITPTLPYMPGTPAQAEIGGGPYVIIDFGGVPHMIVFYKDTTIDGIWQGMGLAFCALDQVQAATTTAPTFTKFGPGGTFTPGLGGESLDLLPGAAPNPWWMDIIHLVDHDRLVMVYHAPELDGSGDALWMRTAPASDAGRWSAAQRLTDAEAAEIIYVTVWSPDDPVSRAPSGNELVVTYVRSRSGWPRDQVGWDRWADAEVVQRTLTWQDGPVDAVARHDVGQLATTVGSLDAAAVGADPAGTAVGLVAGTIARDGSRPPTAPLAMGGQRITGLAAPSAGNDAARKTDVDTLAFNVAAGVSGTIARDGSRSPTANLPMGGHRLTGVGAPVDPNDAARKGDLPSAGPWTALTLYPEWQAVDPSRGPRFWTDGLAVHIDIAALACIGDIGPTSGAIAQLPVGMRPGVEEWWPCWYSPDGSSVAPAELYITASDDPSPGVIHLYSVSAAVGLAPTRMVVRL